jgi:hypothetical protein
VAAVSATLANDGAGTFVLLLVVLLVVMLIAVMRAPRWDASSTEDADDDATRPLPAAAGLPAAAEPSRPVPSRPVPSRPVRSRPVPAHSRAAHPLAGVADGQAQAAAAIARAAAVLPTWPSPGPQSRDTTAMPGHAAAPGRGPASYPARHVAGTLPRPQVTGGPPWGPASKPPGIQ